MGINFNALYHAFQAQVAQPAPQPAPVAAPAPVVASPYQAASEAQSDAAQGMDAAQAIGSAFAGFMTSEPAPAPVEAPPAVAPQTNQQMLQSLQNAITPEVLARIQAQYLTNTSPEQRASVRAAVQGLL